MLNILSDIVDAGAVSPSISGSDKPSNAITTIEPTSDAGIAIILLSIVVIVLIAVIIFLCYRNNKKNETIKTLSKDSTNTNKQDILILYKSLNNEDKAIVENIIKKFSDKEQK